MRRITTEQFIERAKKVHGDKYDYSKTDLDHRDENGKIIIICPKHGEFSQSPHEHMNGKGCKFCYFERSRKLRSKDTEKFRERYTC